MKLRWKASRRVALVAGVASVALVAGAAAQAAISRSGPITSFDGVDAIVEVCTSSTSYTNMGSMSRTFTKGAGEASVVVMFEGAMYLSGEPFDTGFIRLRIDGKNQDPGDIPVIGVDERGTHGFNWQTKALPPGPHTARVQWRTDLGSTFCVDARSLIVLHG